MDFVELENGAGCSFACFWIVDSRHALFDRQGAGAEGDCVGFTRVSCGRAGCEGGDFWAVVVAVIFGRIHGLDAKGANALFRRERCAAALGEDRVE